MSRCVAAFHSSVLNMLHSAAVVARWLLSVATIALLYSAQIRKDTEIISSVAQKALGVGVGSFYGRSLGHGLCRACICGHFSSVIDRTHYSPDNFRVSLCPRLVASAARSRGHHRCPRIGRLPPCPRTRRHQPSHSPCPVLPRPVPGWRSAQPRSLPAPPLRHRRSRLAPPSHYLPRVIPACPNAIQWLALRWQLPFRVPPCLASRLELHPVLHRWRLDLAHVLWAMSSHPGREFPHARLRGQRPMDKASALPNWGPKGRTQHCAGSRKAGERPELLLRHNKSYQQHQRIPRGAAPKRVALRCISGNKKGLLAAGKETPLRTDNTGEAISVLPAFSAWTASSAGS